MRIVPLERLSLLEVALHLRLNLIHLGGLVHDESLLALKIYVALLHQLLLILYIVLHLLERHQSLSLLAERLLLPLDLFLLVFQLCYIALVLVERSLESNL